MKSRKFRIGAIGTGGIFKMCHLPGWKDIPDVEIVGVADVDVQSAKKLAGAEGIAHVFADYRDLLKLDIDAVDICTPNNLHTPMVLAALQAGKHVICEKPLATTVREVRQMGQLADKKKLKLMTAQHQRFTSSARAIRGWVDAGGLGDVYHARVHAMRRAWLPVRPGFIDRKLSGGGPCMDIGVHALDACMWMMDFPSLCEQLEPPR
jgi:predicted dehydrogenase